MLPLTQPSCWPAVIQLAAMIAAVNRQSITSDPEIIREHRQNKTSIQMNESHMIPSDKSFKERLEGLFRLTEQF